MLQVFQKARGAQAEMSEELTVIELNKLDELEAVIERGIKTFNQVGSILMAIRDERLYRTEYGTFEDYCRERWGMSKAYAHRMIASSEVVSNLSPIGDIPQTESQARPLAKLPPEQLFRFRCRPMEPRNQGAQLSKSAWIRLGSLLTIVDNPNAKMRLFSLICAKMGQSRIGIERPCKCFVFKGLQVVGAVGFEPTTSSSQSYNKIGKIGCIPLLLTLC
jgi:hypothetical protein